MITIPANDFKGLALFAAIKDTRQYLKGVHVEQRANQTLLMATDGAMCAVLRLDVTSDTDVEYLIPNTLLANVKTNKGLVTVDYDGVNVALTQDGATVTAKHGDGTFPDVRRVIPSSVSGELAHFDLHLLARIAKAYTLFSGRKACTPSLIAHNGTGAALIDMRARDITGVIMPLNPNAATFSEPNNFRPGWL